MNKNDLMARIKEPVFCFSYGFLVKVGKYEGYSIEQGQKKLKEI